MKRMKAFITNVLNVEPFTMGILNGTINTLITYFTPNLDWSLKDLQTKCQNHRECMMSCVSHWGTPSFSHCTYCVWKIDSLFDDTSPMMCCIMISLIISVPLQNENTYYFDYSVAIGLSARHVESPRIPLLLCSDDLNGVYLSWGMQGIHIIMVHPFFVILLIISIWFQGTKNENCSESAVKMNANKIITA